MNGEHHTTQSWPATILLTAVSLLTGVDTYFMKTFIEEARNDHDAIQAMRGELEDVRHRVERVENILLNRGPRNDVARTNP